MDTKKLIKRSCDGCNVCCEGWLSGTIYGKRMYQGMPCHFKTEKGCGIYKKRPKSPCRDFYCEWLKNTEIPEWFKPNTSKILLRTSKINKIPYLEVIEAGSPLPIEALNWLFHYHVSTRINIFYQIKNGKNWIGSTEFCQAMEKKSNKSNEISNMSDNEGI